MTDWALGANPKNRTSVITETGIVVYNAVQDADEIASRAPYLGVDKIEDVSAIFPGELCFTRTSRRTIQTVSNGLPMNGLQPAFSAFNGAIHEHPSNFRFVGEARNTPQLQGMKGRALGRAFALKFGGTTTIRLNSALPFAARTVLMWDMPRSDKLPGDIVGLNRKLAEMKEYKPSECLTSPLKLHQLIVRQSKTPTNPAMLNNEEEIELSQALLLSAAFRMIGYLGAVKKAEAAGAAYGSTEKLRDAVLFGLIDPDEQSRTAGALASKKASANFVSQFIDSVFCATYNEKTNQSNTDEANAVFTGPEVDLKGGKVRGQAGDPKKKQVVRAQLTAVSDITMSTATLIESRKTRIFAISLTAGSPGQDIDAFYV